MTPRLRFAPSSSAITDASTRWTTPPRRSRNCSCRSFGTVKRDRDAGEGQRTTESHECSVGFTPRSFARKLPRGLKPTPPSTFDFQARSGKTILQSAKLYINFVLTATTYLVMLLALFLSAFSIPADIKSRTIYTVVTKPVRTGEIVLGRMLGFTAIGTVLLIVMGVASYVFVTRTLDHTHELTAADLVEVPSEPGVTSGNKEGKTSLAHGHAHRVTLDANGNGDRKSVV